MKGDGRARFLLKLLEEMPCGVSIFKNDEACPERYMPDSFEDPSDDEGYREWVSELEATLGNEEIVLPEDLTDFEMPRAAGPTWSVLWADDYGDRGTIELAQESDLIKALLKAKNKLMSIG